jgi:tRNA-dihydrouridine synthase B
MKFIETDNNIFLAPMAGICDLPFRVVCKKYNAGMVYSEMVSSKAMYYKDKKTKELLISSDDEKTLAVQIFGSDPDIMAQTAHIALSTGAGVLDINMGCPAPKVANNGDGSTLMKNPDLIYKIVKAVKKEVDVPVTCKIRSGFDKVNAPEVAKIIEEAGADAIAVHPRTRDMYYSGKADWDIIKKIKEDIKIPVIGNGDIFTPEDAKKMFDYTKCDAVMIARGAQGNPFIFEQTNDYLKSGKYRQIPIEEKEDVMFYHLDLLIKHKGEHIGIREFRKHAAWYIKGLKDSAFMRGKINTISSCDELKKELENYFVSLKNTDNM